MRKLKEKAAAGPVATFGHATLYGSGEVGRVRASGVGNERQPLVGVSARVESGPDLEKRVTATRLVTMGLLSLAAKKKSGGGSFLTIEGPEFFWTFEVDRKDRAKAESFAAEVNDAARKV